MKIYDCIVVGSGIAGMTSAIYLKRAGLDVVIFESYIPGGQINNTSNVENYPGFTKIDGPTLVMNIHDQITSMDIPLKYEKVINLTKDNNFIIETNKDKYVSKNVIIATGRTPNKLGIEEEFIGKGVSYCALCDGNLYKDLEVVVVGGGNSAFEESLYLSKLCKKVTILNRGTNLRASLILQEEISKKDNVDIIYNCSIEKINSNENKIVSVTTNKGIINCSGIFIYIGLTPNLDFLNIDVNKENNYIIVDNNMRTNIKGLYACGDVIKKEVYQIITAAGEGAVAASSLVKDVEK